MFKPDKTKTFDTIIGAETTIEGSIRLKTSLRVEGKIIGEVECDGDVIIGKEGSIEPKIKAKNIIVSGIVKGDLYASEKLHILTGGSFSGKAKMNGIIIEEGGQFNGESSMNQVFELSSSDNKKNKKVSSSNDNK